LREELEESLTVIALRMPRRLERVLSTTNLIENLFSRLREIVRRVKTQAGRHHGAALDRSGRARSRARPPQAFPVVARTKRMSYVLSFARDNASHACLRIFPIRRSGRRKDRHEQASLGTSGVFFKMAQPNPIPLCGSAHVPELVGLAAT
jgi:hypothetical protein